MRLLLFLILPTLINSQVGWKIDQPHRYVILNGEYIKLPVEERDTEDNPSILSSLNPVNAFQKIWDSLPSLNFLKNPDSPNEGVEPPVSMEFEQAQESSPAGVSVPFSNFFSDPTSSFQGIGNIFNSVGGFMKKSSHHVERRSLVPVGEEPKGPVRYLYKNLGQGSFVRYEIPVPTPEELASEQHQIKGQDSSIYSPAGLPKDAIPPFYNNPFGPPKFNPKHKPQYTKPYYNHHHHHQHHEEERATDKTNYYNNGGESSTAKATDTSDTDMEDPFPCPTVGFWKYDGVMCTATQAIPPWSCKPIDLVQSGKLVICRNKVYY